MPRRDNPEGLRIRARFFNARAMQPPILPPLNSLYVFAVAGQHLSFKRAAEALRVTPGAVSQQIKLLEHHLGRPLFVRRNRSIALTDEGVRLLLPLRQAMQTMGDAVNEVSARRSPRVLTVSVLPSFAALWLVPRLGRFRRQHPGIEVMVNATPRLVDLTHEPVDVGIRSGPGRYPGLHVERLLPSDLFPVCHPRLLKGPHGLKAPGALRHHTLLHDELQTHWALWLQAHGVTGVDAWVGPVFSDANLTLQAALHGEGVALVSHALTEAALASGTLVRPFALSLRSDFAYYVVCLAGRENEPGIRVFRKWIVQEARLAPSPQPSLRANPRARQPRRTVPKAASAVRARRSRHGREQWLDRE